jgi:hypothetical protein
VVLFEDGALVVGATGVSCAFAGWLTARQIPSAPPSVGGEAPRPRLLHDSLEVVRHVTSQPKLLLPVLAVSWFWLFGATVVSGLPVLAKDVLFANEQVVTLMLALFAIGVGGGSLLAERLLHGDVSARHVPLGGCVMAACAIDLSVSSAGHPPTPELANVARFLSEPGNWRILADLVGLASCLVLVWYGTVMTLQSARLASLTIKNLVFPEWWLLAPLPICFALLSLEFVLRFHRLMTGPRTRRIEATSVA